MSQDIEIDPDSRTIKYYDNRRVGEVSEDAIIEHIQAGGTFINNAQAKFLLDEIDRLRKDRDHYKQAAHDISDVNDHMRKQIDDQNRRMQDLFLKTERLAKLIPPETERGPGFVGQGTWSVFAEKVVEERDAAREGMKQLLVENSELHRVNAGLQEEVTRCGTELDKKKEHANIHLGGKGELHGIDGYGPFNLKQVNKDRWEIWMLHEKVTLYNKKGHRVRGDHNYEGDW